MKSSVKNIGTLALLAGSLHAQNSIDAVSERNFFKKSTFCQPFVSEFESYLPKLEVQLASNCQEYDLSECGKAMKVFQYTCLGVEIPWFSKTLSKENTPRYSFAFATQVSSHLWWDPLELSTSPVLNTDYRLGLVHFKYIRYLYGSGLKNFSIKFAPINHESTHLGDELTLYRERKGYPIKRVNVSYEYSELQFTLNDPGDFRELNNSLRFGMAFRTNGPQDYYTMSKAEGDSTLCIATGLKTEYYIQYNLGRKKGIFTGDKWRNVFSVELRNRPVYNYPSFNNTDNNLNQSRTSLSRCFSINTYFGWTYVKNAQSPTLGLYLHCYAGQNPYGQFRNLVDFKSIGLTFVLE